MSLIFPFVDLDDVCTIKGGKRLPKGEELVKEITQHPYIRARDIGNGKISFTDPVYITNQAYEKISRYIVSEGDVVITIVGANIGDAAFIEKQFDGANLTENAVKLTANNELYPKFLKYSLTTKYMKGYFQTVASGAAQGKLGLYKIKKVQIPLPPFTTQQKIAHTLSAYDDLIENNLKRIKLLEEMAQITYEEWFVRMKFPGHEQAMIDSETGLPEGWIKTTCYEVMDVLSGGTPRTHLAEYWNGDIKFFTPKDAANGIYTQETEKTITQLGLKKCNSKLYPKNTVFITARGTVGKLNLASEAMAMNQSCYALKAKSGLTQFYLYCSLIKTIDAFKGAANGGVFDTIVVDTFKYLPFIKPTKSLVESFDTNITPLFQNISNLLNQNKLLKEARDILLPRLMTGMIDVDTLELPEPIERIKEVA